MKVFATSLMAMHPSTTGRMGMWISVTVPFLSWRKTFYCCSVDQHSKILILTYTIVWISPRKVLGLYELTIPKSSTATKRYWSESCNIRMHWKNKNESNNISYMKNKLLNLGANYWKVQYGHRSVLLWRRRWGFRLACKTVACLDAIRQWQQHG
jgi:hypothetical protein